MFGSIGGPEMVVILIVALLIFGPRRLPALARSLGKAMTELRRASQDFKTTLEREVMLAEAEDKKESGAGSPPATTPRGSLTAGSFPDAAPAPTVSGAHGAAAGKEEPAPHPGPCPDADGD